MDPLFDVNPSKDIPPCPICGAVLELVYHRFGENVFVCIDCHTGVTIPRQAWEIGRVKKAQRHDKPEEKTG